MLFRKFRNRLFPPAAPLPEPAQSDPLGRFRDCPQKLLEVFDILAFEQGLLPTIKANLPIDSAGAPIPWYTYPSIEYLSQFDFRDKRIFEFGSGNSSHYWARLGASVWSVDHNEDWYRQMVTAATLRQTFYLASSATVIWAP